MITWFNYPAILKILFFGLLIGASLPALFALGVRLRATAYGMRIDQKVIPDPKNQYLLLTLSWMIFALALSIVVVGILFIARDFIAYHTGWCIFGAHLER